MVLLNAIQFIVSVPSIPLPPLDSESIGCALLYLRNLVSNLTQFETDITYF